MRIVLLGTGTSFGIPMIGCDCEVCTSDDPRNNRLRSGGYIEVGEARFLVDCTPDFRQQALRFGVRHVDAAFISHSHFDHIAGIDDLRIFTLRNHHTITLYGNEPTIEEIRTHYDYCFNPPQKGGGVPSVELKVIERPIKLHGITVTPIPVKHGILSILGYRFEDFAYITDASFVPDESIALLQGVKVLVINALRQKPHATHFSVGQAIEVAKKIQPKKTYFTHICHRLEHKETNRSLPPEYQLGYDGLTITM